MYQSLRIAVVVPCYNEVDKIGIVVSGIRRVGIADTIVVVDDGSTDASGKMAAHAGADVIRMSTRSGVGTALRAGFETVRYGSDVIVVMAGNTKDDATEIERLIRPIAEVGAHFVQGSRFLGNFGGDIPLHRRMATRLHPVLFSLATGKKVSESTNGFRAFRTQLLEDPEIRLHQTWLNHYELEPYLYFKAITLGYRCHEVAVTKTYPPRARGYTKMTPFVGWWSILRPLLLLRTGLRV